MGSGEKGEEVYVEGLWVGGENGSVGKDWEWVGVLAGKGFMAIARGGRER
jgi:hypothetical protein